MVDNIVRSTSTRKIFALHEASGSCAHVQWTVCAGRAASDRDQRMPLFVRCLRAAAAPPSCVPRDEHCLSARAS